MAKTWFSYVVLAVGLMMLVGSERPSVASDNDKKANSFSFGTEKDIQVFVNKQGDDSASVDLMIDGKKIQFNLPELTDGESKTFTTDDGTEIVVKALSNNHVVWVGDEEINLPGLHMDGMMGKEGLASVITRVHGLSDFQKNSVTVSGHGLSEDAVKAMVDAVQGVLTSYGIEKEVIFRKQPELHVISEDINGVDGNFKFITGGDIEIEVDSDNHSTNNVMVIEKKVFKHKKNSDK